MIKFLRVLVVGLFFTLLNLIFSINSLEAKIYYSNLTLKPESTHSVYNLYISAYKNFLEEADLDKLFDDCSYLNVDNDVNGMILQIDCSYESLKKITLKHKLALRDINDINHNWYSTHRDMTLNGFRRLFKSSRSQQEEIISKMSQAKKKNEMRWFEDLEFAIQRIALDRNTKYYAEKNSQKKNKPSPDDDKIVPAGSGSGFFVSKDGKLITNYHVIEGCEKNLIYYQGNKSDVKILAVDKVNDIAILKTNIDPRNFFAVANEDVSLLEDVIVAGYPLGKEISAAIKTHKGVVTALAGAGDNYSYFQTDAAINQGNSGGPIINQKGNVVGIAVQTWVEEGVQGVHFGIKSSTLKTFASANGLKFLTPNNRDLSNKELGKLITESTVYVECHMTIAKIKKMLAEAENKKAFFKEYK